MMDKVLVKELKAPEINLPALLCYAGIRRGPVPEYLYETIEKYSGIFSYRVAYINLLFTAVGDTVRAGIIEVNSKTLAKALKDCDSLYLVAATVGSTLDRSVAQLSVSSPARAQLLDSFGTERVEALLDAFEKELSCECGRRLRPRVSAGYGDIPLELQTDIFKILAPENKIGLYLNQSLLMTPMKSVTAFIGVKKDV